MDMSKLCLFLQKPCFEDRVMKVSAQSIRKHLSVASRTEQCRGCAGVTLNVTLNVGVAVLGLRERPRAKSTHRQTCS